MDELILISTLNDFIFCPYSIYLHNVYMETDEGLYHATPQIKGKAAHATVDKKSYSSKNSSIVSLPVCSLSLGVMGKIDIYDQTKKHLIERKNTLPKIYQGQIFQLWAQYFCMVEMGYDVRALFFYEMSANKTHPIPLPTDADRAVLENFLSTYRQFDPAQQIPTNTNKCRHCIYCNLCDKVEVENVYA